MGILFLNINNFPDFYSSTTTKIIIFNISHCNSCCSVFFSISHSLIYFRLLLFLWFRLWIDFHYQQLLQRPHSDQRLLYHILFWVAWHHRNWRTWDILSVWEIVQSGDSICIVFHIQRSYLSIIIRVFDDYYSAFLTLEFLREIYGGIQGFSL
jgi:hypothetical protein